MDAFPLQYVLPRLPQTEYAAFDAVAIAASLGGPQAIGRVLSALPADFPAAILVVQHLHVHSPRQLVAILSKQTALRVKWAEQGDAVCPGTVYLAPPDQHMVVTRKATISLSQSPHIEFVRPSANPLFASVADLYGKRSIAIVLTGTGRDGAQGVQAIKRQGGLVLVQDDATSKAFGMPSASILSRSVDHILPLPIIAPALISLTMVKGAATLFRVVPAA